MDFSRNSDLDAARVPPEHGGGGTLFPLSDYGHPPPSPRDVCEEVGLNWMTAVRLHEREWLSFDPSRVDRLDPSREAELRFVGSMVAGGCDEDLLGGLLATLRKPYCYRIDRLLYNWETRSWELRASREDILRDAERGIDRLADTGQIRPLERLRSRIEYYLRESRRSRAW